MTVIRKIAENSKAVPTLEGAGVHLKRAFGFDSPQRHDPFLLLDDFRSNTPRRYLSGFPWHPHRGIETITYVLKGEVEHGDSLGNQGVISAGDVQWMTAGCGIVHQEMPKGDGDGVLQGFQLWINLPAREKMCPPRYRDINSETIPKLTMADGSNIKVICGRIYGCTGPVTGVESDPQFLDISLPPHTTFEQPTVPGHTVLAYVIDGVGRFAPGSSIENVDKDLVLFTDGDQIRVETENEGVRFLFLSGRPLNEPIAWQGPIVMNTQAELVQAFREYREGTFLRHDLAIGVSGSD